MRRGGGVGDGVQESGLKIQIRFDPFTPNLHISDFHPHLIFSIFLLCFSFLLVHSPFFREIAYVSEILGYLKSSHNFSGQFSQEILKNSQASCSQKFSKTRFPRLEATFDFAQIISKFLKNFQKFSEIV